jgi:RNA recognition motif-containing protein
LQQGGQIEFGRIIKGPKTDKDGNVKYVSKGFAIVQFASPEHAANAIAKMDGTNLNGRTLYVKPDTSRGKKGGEAPPQDVA